MSLSKQQIGKVIQWVGWFSVAHTLLTYGGALHDARSDASVRAYASLIALEGLVFLGSGLLIVWFGRWIVKTPELNKPDQPENRQSD
jgi:hypothetical protein